MWLEETDIICNPNKSEDGVIYSSAVNVANHELSLDS